MAKSKKILYFLIEEESSLVSDKPPKMKLFEINNFNTSTLNMEKSLKSLHKKKFRQELC